MREIRIRTNWQEGSAVSNDRRAIPTGGFAEVMAHQGWTSLTAERQHGVVAGHHDGGPDAAHARIAAGRH